MLLCKFWHKKFTCTVCFFSWDSRLTHYKFCLRKWTYFLLLNTQGIVLRALIQEVSLFSRYTPRWSHDYKCGRQVAVAFAECFYAKAREVVPQWLLPPVNRLILYLRYHTVGSLPHSQMVCHQSSSSNVRLYRGHRSFMWRCTLFTKTDCGLITLVTWPLPNFVEHRFCAVLNHTILIHMRFPTW